MIPTVWTEEQTAMLRLIYRGFSYGALADRINAATGSKFTRSAIASKAARTGLVSAYPRRSPKNRDIKYSSVGSAKRIRKPRPKTTTRSVKIPQAPKSNPIPFLDRRMRYQCAFPTSGEGHQMMVCGSNTIDGETYCQFHCAIVYTAPGQLSKPYYFDNTKRRAA